MFLDLIWYVNCEDNVFEFLLEPRVNCDSINLGPRNFNVALRFFATYLNDIMKQTLRESVFH